MSGIKQAKQRQLRRKRKKQIRQMTLIFGSLFLVLVLGLTIRGVAHKINEKDQKTKKTTAKSEIDTSHVKVKKMTISTDKKKAANGSKSITISSMGDCTLGTDENFDQSKSLNAFYNSQGPEYFFQNVRDILEKDDLSIVNFEGTLTTLTSRENKTFAFKADPAYVDILTTGSVEAANIANNHSADYGEQSSLDTLNTLEKAKIAAFGYEQVQLLDVNGVKVGLTGIYELAEHLDKQQQVKENITALKKAGAELIVVNFHWGAEKEYVPNDIQKKLAHLAIDEGAHLVIGHHPHVLQGIEKYKGRYIAYSLGNFCFGGNSNPEDKDTMIFQQTFTIKNNKLKKDENITIIPCSISSQSSLNDYCPTPLEGSEKERVLNKIKEYSSQIEP